MTLRTMGKSNNIETRYLRQEEFARWDELVALSEDGTIFQTSTWLLAFAKWQHLKFRIAGCFKGDQLTGGMAFTCKKKFGWIRVMQIPYKTSFYGPVLAKTETKYISKRESHHQAIIDALVSFLLSENKLFSAILPPSYEDVRPFQWRGFQAGIHYTYLARLSSETDLLSMYDPPLRRQIKKGEQEEHALLMENSPERILQAYTLEQLSFQRQKLDLNYALSDDFVSFILSLAEKGSAQTYVMEYQGKAIAAQVVILDQAKKRAYYWLAGADEEYLSTGLNQLLLHKILIDLAEKGFETFDFVGAGTESIARYKASFNFPLVPFYSVTKELGAARLGMLIKNLIRKS